MTRRSVRLLYSTIKDIIETRSELFKDTLRHNKPLLYLFLTYFFIETFADSVRGSDKIHDIGARVEFSNPNAFHFLKNNVVVEEQVLLNCIKNNVFILSSFVRLRQYESIHRDLLVVLDELFERGLVIKSKISLPKPVLDSDVENTAYSFISLPLVRLKGVDAAFFFPKVIPSRRLFDNYHIEHSVLSLRSVKGRRRVLESPRLYYFHKLVKFDKLARFLGSLLWVASMFFFTYYF